MKRALLSLTFTLALPSAGLAYEVDDDVDITAGAVTGLSCALEARKTGDLTLLNKCPLREALGGIVVYDVVEEAIVRLDPARIATYKLEGAYGGGSIDVTGTVKRVDPKTGVAFVEVEDYSVTKKPKAGGFKGCL